MPERRPRALEVRVVAVLVECDLCGDTARISAGDQDAFTAQVLMPLGSWWAAHLAPVLAMVELQVDGRAQRWHQVVSNGGMDV